MPFVAVSNDELVLPEEVEDKTKVDCIGCDHHVKPRAAHQRNGSFVARHFWHPSGAPNHCDAVGGESYVHRRMKQIAISKAKQRWPNARVEHEFQVADRRTDVAVLFDDRHSRYGKGICIEAQYENKQKDVAAVEDELLEQGYSVLWLEQEQYTNRDVNFDAGDWVVYWCHQVPSTTEWAGYHGIVHWIYQNKDAPVEIEVNFPPGLIESISGRLEVSWNIGYQEQKDEWVDKADFRLTKTSWLSLTNSPSNMNFIQLAKGRGSRREAVHVPIKIVEENASVLHGFACEIESFGPEKEELDDPETAYYSDKFVDKTADPWETEAEYWLENWSSRIKSLLKIIRTPDGELAIELKKIESGNYESVVVCPNDLFTAIRAFHNLAEEFEC